MKICVIGPTYPYRGGMAHYTTLLVKHLRAAGHATRFYSFTRQYPRWLFPGKTDKDPSAAPLKEPCEYVLDPINPLTWWRLLRKVRADRPDLVILQWWHPYWTPMLVVLARSIKRRTNARLLFVVHNVMPHDGGGFIDRRLALTVLYYGDAHIVHSDQDLHRMHALLPNAQVIKARLPTYEEVGQQHATLSSAALRAQLQLPPDVPVILFFGFVRPYKGLEYLIQALPLVLQTLPVHLLIVGEFWSPPEVFYQQYAHEYGVDSAVTILNHYVPDEELQAYFDLAEVVVLPYVSATQSAVAQLAFGLGKPVITSRVGGLHEVVQDGVTGLIVPPQDDAALAAAIVRFFEEQLGPEMVHNVRHAAHAERFSWQQLVQIVEQASQKETT